MIRDLKLTQIMLQSLKREPALHTPEDWVSAGDFAIELRFYPHAFHCFQNALELSKTQEIAEKLNDVLDRITNVLEVLPDQLALHIDEFRLNNPLDPEKWLELANKLLKQNTSFADSLDPKRYESERLALAMTAYCTMRLGEDIAPINHVLSQLIQKVDASNFISPVVNFKHPEPNKALRVVAYGDQVTLGLQPGWELRYEETYHYLWSHDSAHKINVVNCGTSGASALDALLYLKRDVLNYKPDITIISFGLNDAWFGQAALLPFEVIMTSVVELLKPHTQVILLSPVPHIPAACPPDEKPTQVDLKEVEIKAWANALKRVSLHTGVPLADVTAEFPNDLEERRRYLSNGYNQANLAGHQLIKHAIDKVLVLS
jgi:lysophospholipase L1-like esterase